MNETSNIYAYPSKTYSVQETLEGKCPKFSPSGLNKLAGVNPAKLESVSLKYFRRQYNAPSPTGQLCHFSIDSLDLPITARQEIIKKTLQKVFTFKEYMEYALYNREFDYYTSRPKSCDYETNSSSNSPYYGAALAEIVIRLWAGMVNAGTFQLHEQVDICELGGGNGIFAQDFMCYIKAKATQHEELWGIFYQNILYRIGETSTALRRKQKKTTSSLKDKITVLYADARKLKKTFPKDSLQGFILSNELLDTFPSHKIRKHLFDQIEVAISVPYLISLEQFFSSLSQKKTKQTFKRLLPIINRENEFLKQGFECFCSTKPPPAYQKDICFLTKQTYQTLREYTQSITSDLQFRWQEYWVPISYFDDVLKFCKEHPDYIKLLPVDQPMPLNTELRKFQKGCGHILKKGVQITIDYQYDNFAAVKQNNGFRAYPDGGSPPSLLPPGTVNITTNINATALAAEGIRAKLEPFLFCTENELFSMTPYFRTIQTHKNNEPPLHALIMNKRDTKVQITFPMLSRPITYRDLFLAISNWSGIATPGKRCTSEKIFLVTRQIFESYRRVLHIMSQNVQMDLYWEKLLILQSTEKKSPELEGAMQALFHHVFYGQKRLFEIAKEYSSFREFDYRRIADYFSNPYSSDKTDRLMIQMIHQLLQFHYEY